GAGGVGRDDGFIVRITVHTKREDGSGVAEKLVRRDRRRRRRRGRHGRRLGGAIIVLVLVIRVLILVLVLVVWVRRRHRHQGLGPGQPRLGTATRLVGTAGDDVLAGRIKSQRVHRAFVALEPLEQLALGGVPDDDVAIAWSAAGREELAVRGKRS